MDSQGANTTQFDFNAMKFDAFSVPNPAYSGLKTSGMDNTFFGDEGIDTTESFGQQFDSMFVPSTDYSMQPLALDNTSGSASWGDVNTTFPPTPVQSFDTLYGPQLSAIASGKRPLQLDVQDFPQSKRHEGLGQGGVELGFSPYPTSASLTGSSWAIDTQPTSASSIDMIVGLSDEAADVCATWFSKYNVLPSDRHIDSLSQLTGESATAIRQWFGQALKQGLGHDSAYKSQTSFTQDQFLQPTSQSTSDLIDQPAVANLSCFHDAQAATTTAATQATPRGGKKGCNPTDDPELLSRDPKKIYQCTRKCGKRYGRKCDWKRNEEEGYPSKSWVCSLCIEQNTERVKPCFRKYHFSQHFRNVHPGLDCADHEEASVVHNDTAFPRRCGFCTHCFVSRQDRIDHIAEHFKEGKCMLEWNDDDSSDSDNTDDDDDDNNDGRPDGGDFSDNGPFYPPTDDQHRGGSSSSKGSGSGGGSSGQQQSQQPSFFQFHLQQCSGADTEVSLQNTGQPGGPAPQVTGDQLYTNISQDIHIDDRETSQGGIQHDKSASQPSCDRQLSTGRELVESLREEQRSIHGQLETTKGVDTDALARDALSQSLALYQKNRPVLGVSFLDSFYGCSVAEATRKLETLLQACALKSGDAVGGGGGGRGMINVRTMNALLELLDPANRQPPLLPPPLPLPEKDIGDVLVSTALIPSPLSWQIPKLSTLKALITDRDPGLKLASMLPDQNLDLSIRGMLQQCLKGIKSLLDQQSTFHSIRLLGAGGFSTVDEVIHRETGLRISRKTLKNRHSSALEEIKKEVDVLQKLRHPHVINFLGVVQKGDKMSILLSPVAETTLALWLDQKSFEKPVGLPQTIVKMFGCLASTIRYLHEQRSAVTHGDIKPQNILVMEGSQEFPHVVLSDFGISSSADMTQDGKLKPLTRQYCAPEVSEGISREKASDIWSLGCVFAEMATVAFSNNTQWLEFRSQFLGRKANYYCQEIPALQDWLTQVGNVGSKTTEASTVVSTVKSMLSSEPSKRPNASELTMIFMPAPCCLSWPNEQASYPGPLEETHTVEMLVHEEGVECRAHLQCSATDKQANSAVGDLDPRSQAGTLDEPFSHAKQWLFECSFGHEACHHDQRGATVLPTRLIDLRPDGIEGMSVRIVNSAELKRSSEPVSYAALSYTWGQSDMTLCAQASQRDLPRALLSPVVNDSISATSGIGYRYLWVDSLCVEQDSPSDKERECRAMADVFRNADVTLVVDQLNRSLQTIGVANDRDRTFSGTPTPQNQSASIDMSAPGFAWETRAWSLQERLLSRRLLYLGEQMYWECNTLKASETFPHGLDPLLWERVHTKTNAAATSSTTLHIRCDYRSSGCVKLAVNVDDIDSRNQEATWLEYGQRIEKEGDGMGDPIDEAHTSLVALQGYNAPLDIDVDARVSIDAFDNVKSKIQDKVARKWDMDRNGEENGMHVAIGVSGEVMQIDGTAMR